MLYKINTVLYQFLETGTSDRTFMGLDQLLKCLGFILYPFHFFFTVTLIYGSYEVSHKICTEQALV